MARRESRKWAFGWALALLLGAFGCQDPISDAPPDGGILNPGAGKPDTVKTPGTGNPGTGHPGTGNPDTVKTPGTGDPGTGNPGTGLPGTGNPQDTVKPPAGDTVKPDTGRPADPGATGFASLLPEEVFNRFFPRRNSFYTYQGLVQAAAGFPAFAGTGDVAARKREIAAFLGNVAHETGYLVYIEQIEQGEYCGHDWSGRCACQPGKKYYGRGPLQLSWNYNYGAAGAAVGAPLCQDPDLVARDAKIAWGVALWFWMTSSGAGSATCHAAMNGGAGFGATIQTINGSVECGGRRPDAVAARQSAYKTLCRLLGVEPGENLGC